MAAGIVGLLRHTRAERTLFTYSAQLYKELEEEGYSTGQLQKLYLMHAVMYFLPLLFPVLLLLYLLFVCAATFHCSHSN